MVRVLRIARHALVDEVLSCLKSGFGRFLLLTNELEDAAGAHWSEELDAFDFLADALRCLLTPLLVEVTILHIMILYGTVLVSGPINRGVWHALVFRR